MYDRKSNIAVFETRDYSKFKKLEGNRAVLEKRANAIMKSIKEIGYQIAPILINEKFEVIDGQGRLEACKRLGLPVLYVIQPGIGLNECVAMNINMSNWMIKDFIGSYAAQGNRNYIRLLDLNSEYENIGIYEIAMCMSDTAWSKNVNKQIKVGKYVISETEDNINCLKFISSVCETLKNVRGGLNYYIPVLVGLYKYGLLDDDRMKDQLDKYTKNVSSAYDYETALNILQEVYNFRKRQSSYFRDEYLKNMEKKGARYKKR